MNTKPAQQVPFFRRMPPHHTKTESWALSRLNTFFSLKKVCNVVTITIQKHYDFNWKNVPNARVRTNFWCSFHLWTMISSCCLQEGTFSQKSGIWGTLNYHHFQKNMNILYRAQIKFFRLFNGVEHLVQSFLLWIHKRKVIVQAQKS